MASEDEQKDDQVSPAPEESKNGNSVVAISVEPIGAGSNAEASTTLEVSPPDNEAKDTAPRVSKALATPTPKKLSKFFTRGSVIFYWQGERY